MEDRTGRMVCICNGVYDNIPIEVVTSRKKAIDVDKYYSRDRLRPLYKSLGQKPLLIMTSDY